MISSKERIRRHYEHLKEGGRHSCFVEATVDLYNGPMLVEEDLVEFIDVPRDADNILSYVRARQEGLTDKFNECTVYAGTVIYLDKPLEEQLEKEKVIGLSPIISL